MTQNHREVMQQALEALDSDNPEIQLRAAMSLRAALAEPVQEPVAWMHNEIEDNIITHRPASTDRHPEQWTALYKEPLPCPTCESLARAVMLDQTSYDSRSVAEPVQEPVAKVELMTAWQEGYDQGVADERTSDVNIGISGFGAKVTPARNNPYTAPPQRKPEPVQEPVYWEVRCTAHPRWMRVDEQRFDEYVAYGWEGQRLYTTPPQRKPLTDEEIDRIIANNITITDPNLSGAVYMAMRELETSHGITGEST